MKIGIVWSGNPLHSNDLNRSIGFNYLSPLLARANATFFSLQPNVADEDPSLFQTSLPLIDLGKELADFDITAAIVRNLDLVIAVDTSVAHLSAALGVPTWILLPFSPDWRWQLERTDSPWYSAARLFRQSSPGNWLSVVTRVMTSLNDSFAVKMRKQPLSIFSSEQDLLDKAYDLYDRKLPVSAKYMLSQLLWTNPTHAEALHLSGVISYSEGDIRDGISIFEKALAAAPENTEYRANLASMLAQDGRIEEAQTHFEAALSLDPEYLPARTNLARLLFYNGREQQALTYVEAVSSWPGDDLEFNKLASEVFQSNKMPEKAITALSCVVALNPQDQTAAQKLAYQYSVNGKPDKAQHIYESILHQNADNVAACSNLALLLINKDEFPKAQSLLEHVQKLEPQKAETYCNLGHLYHRLKNYNLSDRYFSKALEIEPNNARARFYPWRSILPPI